MNTLKQKRRFTLTATAAIALALAGWSTLLHADNVTVLLGGGEEVPQVNTKASGNGKILVTPNKLVSGTIKTTGILGTAAHIHSGRPGQNGPVVVPLSKTGDNIWSVPAGTKLTDAAYKDFEAGNLYINIHSEAHPDGEIRSQLVNPPWLKDLPKDVSNGGGGGY